MDNQQPTERRPAPPPVPADINAFNRKLIEEFRANKGQLSGQMAGRSLLILTTKGARSGQERSCVLGYGKDGDRYVVIASANGAVNHPAWYRNLLKNGDATIEVGPEKFKARVHTAKPEERERLKKFVPYIESQQKLTSREIPIVVFEKE
jgi:deazaflavin-dependent oxidoreductase (nitroreductase family)